jgi:hypothetical protein
MPQLCRLRFGRIGLIPSHPDDKNRSANARGCFIEMCLKLQEMVRRTTPRSRTLMQADLKSINAKLDDTIAAPLTTESRPHGGIDPLVLNVNGQARFMRAGPGRPPPSRSPSWIATGNRGDADHVHHRLVQRPQDDPRSVTLWIDLAVNNLAPAQDP